MRPVVGGGREDQRNGIGIAAINMVAGPADAAGLDTDQQAAFKLHHIPSYLSRERELIGVDRFCPDRRKVS